VGVSEMAKAVSAPSAGLVGKGLSTERNLLVALALVSLAVAHLSTIQNLLQRWGESGDYSNGYFIPLITGWLLWTRRVAISNSIGEPVWLGVALIALSVVMLVAGDLTYIFVLNHVALVVVLIGLTAVIGGKRLLAICLVPLIFLIFMIPLPYFVATVLTWKLQLISSSVGAFFIGLLGIPVFLDGNIIDLGTYKLGVVEACSGLRYLMPLLSLGFLAAYMFRGQTWQKVVIFLLVFPIAVLLNGVRIALVASLAHFFGVPPGTGFMHLFEGWVVFLGCVSLLYLTMMVFARTSQVPGGFLRLPSFKHIAPDETSKGYDLRPLVTATGILLLTALAVQFGPQRVVTAPKHAPLSQLPLEFDRSWQYKIQRLDADVEETLGADDYLVADLRNNDGGLVNVYVAYLDSQRDGRSWHSPRQCMPGGGWTIIDLTRKVVQPAMGQPFTLNRAVIEHGSARQLVYYWYQQRGRKIADEWMVKYYVIVDALAKHRTDGSLIRLTTPISADENVEKADLRLSNMLGILTPILPKYVPN
jgi:exosortase D (VPLPA-CTERM-specific)